MGVLLAAACSAAPLVTSAPPGPTPTITATTATSPAAEVQPTPPSSAGPTQAATDDPLSQRTIAEIAVPGGPDFPVEAFGSLWLLTPDSDEPSVTRLDPDTYEIVATIPIGGRLCQAIGATSEAIWACSTDGVVRIDPTTNTIAAKVEFPTAGFYGYFPGIDGALWALSGEVFWPDTLVRVDADKNRIAETVELGFPATWLSAGDEALWLTDTQAGKLWRFDLSSGQLTEHATGLPAPGASAVGAGSIWLAVRTERENRPAPSEVTLVRINAATGEVEAELVTGGTLFEGMIHAADDAVWVRSADPFLVHIDPATNEVVETFKADYAGGTVTVAYDSVWATSFDFDKVWRLEP